MGVSLDAFRTRLEGDLEVVEEGRALYTQLAESLEPAANAAQLIPVPLELIDRAIELEQRLGPAIERVRRRARSEGLPAHGQVMHLLADVQALRRTVGERLTYERAPTLARREWLVTALHAAEPRALREALREVTPVGRNKPSRWVTAGALVVGVMALVRASLGWAALVGAVLVGLAVIGPVRRRWIGLHTERRALVIWTGYFRPWKSTLVTIADGDVLELEDALPTLADDPTDARPAEAKPYLLLRRADGSITGLGEFALSTEEDPWALLQRWAAELGSGARDRRDFPQQRSKG